MTSHSRPWATVALISIRVSCTSSASSSTTTGRRTNRVGPAGTIWATSSTSRRASSLSVTNSSISTSRAPLGKIRAPKIWELLTRIVSPVTARSVVERSDTSSTTPDRSSGSITIVSPTENQPSKNISRPATRSVRKRWPANPISTTSSDAPAIAVLLVQPSSWPIEIAIANPYAR